MTHAKKRRILLFVLLFPSILAIVLITVLGNQQARAKRFAKKWLKENHPESELLSVSFGETKVDGVVTEKSLNCECFDTEYGFYYTQIFLADGLHFQPADRYARSYGLMTDCRIQAEWYAETLTEKGYPCDVICFPNRDWLCSALLPAETDPAALAAFCTEFQQMTQGEIGQLPEILVCTESVRGAILSADKAAVWRRLESSLPNAAGNAAAALLGKDVTGGIEVRGSFESIIETAQQTAMPDDKTMWQITPDGDTASLLIYTLI
jgi:hypothetical protein